MSTEPAPSATRADEASGSGLWVWSGWTAATAVLWIALTLWHPTTTWHLAPVLVAGLGAWVVGQDVVPGVGTDGPARVVLRAAAAGLVVAWVETFALDAAGRLAGPTLTGGTHAARESLALAVLGAALAATAGLVRARRRPVSATATLGGVTIATSDRVVVVEGNAYFPLDSVEPGVLSASRTHTVCPWKGLAGYYDVESQGYRVADGAWTYRHPSPLARRIRGHVAFWKDVEVTTGR